MTTHSGSTRRRRSSRGLGIALGIVIVVFVIVGLQGLRIVQEYERGVIFRLGRCVGAKGPGLFFIIPGL